MDLQKLKLYKYPILFSLGCIAFYISFAYDLERSDFIKLIGLYGGLFFLSFKLIQVQKQHYWILVSLALIFRLIFIGALPNLSQDYFRFIWDGRLLAEGWNPYEFLPSILIGDPDLQIQQARQLLEGMGGLSAVNYTNYAPVNQLIFAFAGWLAPGNILFSVILMRIVIILADFGTLYFGTQLLRSMGLPDHRVFWYFLNPFIIIELTGNLHFEGVMVFFMVSSIYLLHKGRWIWSAILFGLSILVKLVPLMFLPLLFRYFTGFSVLKYFKKDSKASTALSQTQKNNSRASTALSRTQEDASRGSEASTPLSRTNKSSPKSHPERSREVLKKGHPEPSRRVSQGHPARSREVLNFKKLILYYLLVLVVVIAFFLPFFNPEVLRNFTQSIGLWFGKFEFNASIYYIIRWVGFQLKGYNTIETVGFVLPWITFVFIIGLSLFGKFRTTKGLLTNMMFAITAYLLLSTTVHPWYLAIPLILSIFTEFRYLIVWTALVFLSYFAYSTTEYEESLWLVGLEYLLLFGYLIWELLGRKSIKFIR